MLNKFNLSILILISNISLCFALPPGFVYLEDIDPRIRSSLMYFGENNFIGHPIRSYNKERVILTRSAAEALKDAETLFEKGGFSILIRDSYRPQDAVNQFIEWSENPTDTKMKKYYYPRIDKAKVFELGYVAKKSGHNRGSTVDITLIHKDKPLQQVTLQKRKLNDGFEFSYLDDGTVDFGSHVDLFDQASHYKTDLISELHQSRRTYLKDVMESCGFKNYDGEWWHFTLKDEPFPANSDESYFNFPVE